jgi:hypothetical protein
MAERAREKKSLTVSSVAKTMADFGFTAAYLARAKYALISADGDAVKYLFTGDAPTTTVGHELPDAATHRVNGNTNVNNLKFIRCTGDVTVTVVIGY